METENNNVSAKEIKVSYEKNHINEDDNIEEVDAEKIETEEEFPEEGTEDISSQEIINQAKGSIKDVIKNIRNGNFEKMCDRVSAKTKLPKRKVAYTFATKILGTIGDGSRIVFGTFEDICMVILAILYKLLTIIVHLAVKIVLALISFLTFNYTAKGYKQKIATA